MIWESFSDFIHMSGHGYYVWSAYAMVTFGIVAELYFLIMRRRRICQRLMREIRVYQTTLEK